MFPDPMRAFLLVVQTGSVRKASDRLGFSPSSVSRQIAILERQLGTSLFQRSANGLSLTHAGAMVADYAETTVTGFDALRSDIDDMRGSQRHITVAMVESITSTGPAEAARKFRETHPGVTFDFHVLPGPQVLEAVRNGKCDMAIAFCMPPAADIRVVSRALEPIILLGPVGLAEPEKPISLSILKDHAVAVPEATFGVRQMFDRACAEENLVVRPALETNSFEALRDFVRTGAGVSILPFRAAVREHRRGTGWCYRIDHPSFTQSTLDVIVTAGQRLPRLNRLFLNTLSETLDSTSPVS